MNPTTYDMNLVIYDIVYNDTTEYSVTNNYYENATNVFKPFSSIYQDPRHSIYNGLKEGSRQRFNRSYNWSNCS